MIKLKKSKSKYSQYYKQYQRKVSALRKQNIELRGANVYQTESQLRKWGIQGRDLAKITRQLKADIKNLAEQEAFSTATGEISTVAQLKHKRASDRAKRSAETRKRNKESAREFWTTYKQPTIHDLDDERHLNQPQLGDIAKDNFIEAFLKRLTSPVDTKTIHGRNRKLKAIERSEQAQSALLSLFRKALDIEGDIIVGERLANNWDIIQVHLELILVESSGVSVTSSLEAVGKIIIGRDLTFTERDDLDTEQENMFSWDIEDNVYE